MMRDFLNWCKLNRRPQTRGNRGNRRPTNYCSLESRELLAGIVFEGATGDLYIAGDGSDNIGSVEVISGSELKANLNGFASRTFAITDINRVVFLGFGGDDQFANRTWLPSLQIGGDGNDLLEGGSQYDQLSGGRGNDTLRGNDGDDRLVGLAGNDTIWGGAGNDSIFGGDGINNLRGEAGNDLIFGGDQIDTIHGGAGIDQIYALGGDDILFSGDGGDPTSAGVGQADLILGLAGNDQIFGGAGLNVFYGGQGDDVLIGGDNAVNRLHGQAGSDTLTGGGQGDYLAGGLDDDTVQGMAGADYIVNGDGDDSVDGGAGNDTYTFTGNHRQYRINGATSLSVRDMRDVFGNQGTDDVTVVERFQFADGFQVAESPIVESVRVRPIVVANDDGSSRAVSFGSAAVETHIKNLIDDIYYQANVDVVWENEVGWNNTFANQGSGGTRPRSDLRRVVDSGDAAGVGSSNFRVVDLYFVDIVAGFGVATENQANGLAFLGKSGTMIHIGDNLVTFASGQAVVAKVIAHEIAHNLGLNHVDAPDNLMDRGTNLNAAQVVTILDSPLTV